MNKKYVTIADIFEYLSDRYSIHEKNTIGEYNKGVRYGYAACMSDIIEFVKAKKKVEKALNMNEG